jgi:DNA-binding response OmpR family regulator
MYTINDLHKYSDRLNVLYVEDDENLRAETATLFKMFFKNLDTAEDGLRGLEAFNNNFYDLVISDVNMPNMNGIEMCKKIKEINPEQKTVIISAHDESNILMDLIRTGANGFILKPMQLDGLIDALYPVCRDAYTQIINIELIDELNAKNAQLEKQNRELRVQGHAVDTKHHQLEALLQEKEETSLKKEIPEKEAEETIHDIPDLDASVVDDYFAQDDDEGSENVLFLPDHSADLSEIFTEIPEIISRYEANANPEEIHKIANNLLKASSILMYYSPYLDIIASSFNELATTIQNHLDDFVQIMNVDSQSILMLFDAVSSDIERYIERFSVESLAMKNTHHIHEPTALSIQQIITLIVPPAEDEGDMDDIFDF